MNHEPPEYYDYCLLGTDADGEPTYVWRRHGWQVLAAADALANAIEALGYTLPARADDALAAYRALRTVPETAHSAQQGEE